jgi:c-di-GMP-binding flagellar brake protein YcgR
LFWKKTPTKSDPPKILFESSEEIRQNYRVVPASDDPVELTLDNKSVSVIDISSGGFRCKNNKFIPGKFYSFVLFLPEDTQKICGKAQVLEITETNLCRGQFSNLNPEHENLIHRYTLNRQKEELENRNKQRKLSRRG